MRGLGVLTLALSGFACTVPARDCRPDNVTETPFPTDIFGFLGEPWSVTHTVDTVHACRGTLELTVSPEGYGPDNAPLAVTASTPTPNATGILFSATTSFTPTQLGSHHLAVSLDPGYGTFQYDVFVPRDARGIVPYSLVTSGVSECPGAHLTDRGGLLCTDTGTESRFLRDGRLVQRFPRDAWLHAADQVIWVLDADAGLTRRRDTGSGPLSIEPGSVAGVVAGPMTGTDDALIIAQPGGVSWFAAEDGGLLTRGYAIVQDGGTAVQVAWSPDASVALVYENNRWARVPLLPTTSLAQPEWTEGIAFGTEGMAGLWMLRPQTDELVLRTADPAGPSPSVHTDLIWTRRAQWNVAGPRSRALFWNYVVSQSRDAVLLTARDGGADLALYRAPEGAVFTGADEKWLHAQAGTSHFFYPLK